MKHVKQPRCIGAATPLLVHGCGGPRTERTTGDPRLRWLCTTCAEATAATSARRGVPVAGPRQLAMFNPSSGRAA
jgi:hypothetical protein